jgi:hypothetical protein
VSTGAPSGMSLMVVKFSLPWRTCTIVKDRLGDQRGGE